jgi:hypothetical protein
MAVYVDGGAKLAEFLEELIGNLGRDARRCG